PAHRILGDPVAWRERAHLEVGSAAPRAYPCRARAPRRSPRAYAAQRLGVRARLFVPCVRGADGRRTRARLRSGRDAPRTRHARHGARRSGPGPGGYVPALGERIGVIISGGNTTAVDFGAR